MFLEEEIKALRENRFVIDGMNITLTKRGDSSDVYQGSGFVRQTPAGDLEYTVYDQRREMGYREFLSLAIGELIPDGMFYDLELKDLQGRVWRGMRTLPSTESGFGEEGTICRGKLFEISFVEDTIEKDNLWMFFPGSIDIPTNDGSRIVESILGRESHRFNPNIWKIDDEDYDIVITKHKDGIEVDLAPLRHILPAWFEMRFCESLWFALASPVHWQLLEEYNEGKHRFIIGTKRNDTKPSRIWPILILNHGDSAPHLGNLLIRYLKYVLAYSEDRFHPISATILRNLSASAVSLNSEALALSVAIESLLEREFKTIGRPSKAFIFALESLSSHIELWSGSTSLKERAVNAFSMWKGQNVREALNTLVEEGVISKNHYEAWNTLRHRFAHGKELNRPPNELARLCDLTYLCWIRIMFHLLEYVGPYTDTSIRGRPIAYFPLNNTDTP